VEALKHYNTKHRLILVLSVLVHKTQQRATDINGSISGRQVPGVADRMSECQNAAWQVRLLQDVSETLPFQIDFNV
jgi:hypothetical protein